MSNSQQPHPATINNSSPVTSSQFVGAYTHPAAITVTTNDNNNNTSTTVTQQQDNNIVNNTKSRLVSIIELISNKTNLSTTTVMLTSTFILEGIISLTLTSIEYYYRKQNDKKWKNRFVV